jgi:hypothetical protein
MMPTADFVINCCDRNNRRLPPELLAWILVMYNDEPYEDCYDAYTLEGLICGFCDAYAQGHLDVTIPLPHQLLQQRYAAAKNLISDLIADNQYLSDENDRYYRILKEHGLI